MRVADGDEGMRQMMPKSKAENKRRGEGKETLENTRATPDVIAGDTISVCVALPCSPLRRHSPGTAARGLQGAAGQPRR
jgi:hypothetical protein